MRPSCVAKRTLEPGGGLHGRGLGNVKLEFADQCGVNWGRGFGLSRGEEGNHGCCDKASDALLSFHELKTPNIHVVSGEGQAVIGHSVIPP